MKTLLLAFTLIIAMPCHAVGQTVHIDPARDLALHTTIRGFLDGALPEGQLETELRDFARAFEAHPYKMGTAKIDWEKVPQERLFALVRVTDRITSPAQQAFVKGELTPIQAALKMAPFFLIWPGHGMDTPPDDPILRRRTDELLADIHKFSAP
jgi:hypothetical protein